MFRIGENGFPVLMALLGVAYIVFWIYTLIDVIKRDFEGLTMKIVWILIILFAQVLGPVLYWVIVDTKT
ncbi:PLDc N-terminal domain-containing protein [Anditalea andensis]|uniref:Cardiolipin synthase N-terminal domain-containing protein n=1 Tax=Anditalea andensis TaxID=1048983 RepID=A0A074KQC3_9BACT|nr:PLDc N-terminal domain-containing protein [Anditalea andensis]KEO72126.1 hypothetical protein EL17_19645 [Anditalea andensis]